MNAQITEKLCVLGVLPCLYQSRKAKFLEFAPPLIATESELNKVLDRYQFVLKSMEYGVWHVGI